MANTPNIRFKGFTDDWEQRKLSDLIIEYKETVDSDCTLPVLTSSKTEGVVLQEEHFGRVQNHDITGYNILPRNYCTYRNRSDGVDFTFNINRCCDIGIISKFYPVFYGNNSDIFFISMVLNYCDEVVHEIAYTCTGTGQKVLSFLDLQKMNIRVPSYDEQKKISQYFEQLDNLITLHQRKCDETKELKKFMLQKMFPKNGEVVPEIRFTGFTNDWEQRKLGDFGKATGGTSIESEFSEDGKYKVISIGSYSEDSVYRDQGIRAIESEKTKNRVLNKDDLTMILNDKTSSGNIIGRVLLIEESGVYVYNQRTERIEIDHNNYDALFIYEMLNAPQIRDKIVKQSQGNTQIYVNWSTIAETDYLVPQIDEQRCLGEYFSNLDNLITLHQRKCDEIKELKKYMLQNMFPTKG